MLTGIWAYRYFIIASIKAEFFGRFARSKIGAIWFILHPLSMALIYALVLSEVLGAKLGGIDNQAGYALYLLSGVTAWGIFSETANRGMMMFIDQGEAIKKVAFPKICIPLIMMGNALINQLILFTSVAVIFIVYQQPPTIHWLAIPVGLVLLMAFGFGIGLLCGVLNVFARDVGQVMSVVLNLWFWLTPIVYSVGMLPESMTASINNNPATPLVAIYQDAMIYNQWPNWESLFYPISIIVVLLILGFTVFRKAASELVDAL